MGGLDKLLETLKKRLEEQKERHQGRQQVDWYPVARRRSGRMVTILKAFSSAKTVTAHFEPWKVWDKREFANLDSDTELGSRNMKLALKKLRQVCPHRRI